MAGAKAFTELRYWQRARQWSKCIYWRSKETPFCDDRRLFVQINDSSESVTANIAEGFGRGTQGEFIQFLGYAIGSLDETKSHLCTAYDRDYLGKDEFAELFQEGIEIRKMSVAFIGSMVKAGSGVKHMRKIPNFTDEVWERYERITGKQRPEIFRRPQSSE